MKKSKDKAIKDMEKVKQKLIGIILEAESDALLGNELKDEKMLKKAQCNRVADKILKLVKKEIIKKLPEPREGMDNATLGFNRALLDCKKSILKVLKI